MAVRQISVFVENRTGKLVDVIEILGDAKIDIRALSIADTADFGILRIIVNRPEEVADLLHEKGYVVRLTDVLAVSLPDTPGSLARVLRALSNEHVNLEYTYAFVSYIKDKAYVVLRVEDNERAVEVLAEHDVLFAEESDMY